MTNLRFADDILLVAISLKHITEMLDDLSVEAAKVGLQLHPDKTQILHNTNNTTRVKIPTHACANGMRIEIVAPRSLLNTLAGNQRSTNHTEPN